MKLYFSDEEASDEYGFAHRPMPEMEPTVIDPPPQADCEPFGIERIPRVKADFSIPTIEGVAATADELTQERNAEMRELLNAQIERDAAARTRICEIKPTLPPEPRTEFQTARLFFANLGLLELESVTKQVIF